ncbi:MAG: FHA domain-containing protein, partial [Myxococcales bacterium]
MATLVFRSPDGTEQKKELAGELTVGREGGGADVLLPDKGVSRQHCKLYVAEDGQVWVEDLGSANGSFVDGQQIAGPTPLGEASELRIGESSVKLARRSAAAPRRPTSARAPAAAAPSTALAAKPK